MTLIQNKSNYSFTLIFAYFITTLCLLFMLDASALPLTIQVTDNKKQNLSGVIVYLNWLDGIMDKTSKSTAIDIRQKDKGFKPYLSVIQSNTTVTFSNLDDITHHIYSVTGNEKFSYTIKSSEVTAPMLIEQSGLIAMGCNIHDWMSGYLLVIDSPFYGLTDIKGKVSFNLPKEGRYQVVVWHPQLNESPNELVIIPETNQLTIELTKEMSKIPAQKGIDDFDFLEGY